MYLNNIVIRHVKIIPKQSKKNIPYVSSNDILLPIINLIIILKISKPNRIKINAFDGTKYISLFLISNLENLIKKKEKKIPTSSASITSEIGTRNIGNKNIKAPVLINKGGKIIFLIKTGFFQAPARNKYIVIAIT